MNYKTKSRRQFFLLILRYLRNFGGVGGLNHQNHPSRYATVYTLKPDTRWHSWLRHCVTSRKVEGSIPDGVIVIIHWRNPSGQTVALGSTHPLTEMSTRNIFWGKGGRCVGMTTLLTSCADCHEIWEPQTPGTIRASSGLCMGTFTFYTLMH